MVSAVTLAFLSSFGKENRGAVPSDELPDPEQVCPECDGVRLPGDGSPSLSGQQDGKGCEPFHAVRVQAAGVKGGKNAMADDDRQLLLDLRRMTEACGAFCTGVIENDLSREEQLALSEWLEEMAGRVRERGVRTVVVVEGVVEGEAAPS